MQIDKMRVSNEAFLEEIENWELTLSRQNKKLKGFRTRIKSKIQANELDILITSIEAEMIQYRKYKDPKKLQKFDLIEQYNLSSRKFMDLMESIGNFADQTDKAVNDSALDASEIQKQNFIDASNFYNSKSLIGEKSKKQAMESIPKATKKTQVRKKQSFQGQYQKNNSMKVSTRQIKRGKATNRSYSRIQQSGIQEKGEEYDAWEIKYQLKEIKSMMMQIQNEIKYHSHEDIESQLGKIEHNNKKMGLQLKAIREDNQYVMNRIQKLSQKFINKEQQLQAEKEIQNQMITEFETPQHRVSFKQSRRKKQNEHSYLNEGSQNQEQILNKQVYRNGCESAFEDKIKVSSDSLFVSYFLRKDSQSILHTWPPCSPIHCTPHSYRTPNSYLVYTHSRSHKRY